MTPFTKVSLISSLVAALSIPVLVNAQAPSAPGAQARKPAATAERRPFSRPTERAEARLAYQRTALKITDAQQAQWNAYAEFVRKQAAEREQRFASRGKTGAGKAGPRQAHARGERPSTIERLERRQALHAQAIRQINERLAVQKPLYTVLSPEQQKVADVVLNPRVGERHGREHGRQGRHGQRGHFGRTARG